MSADVSVLIRRTCPADGPTTDATGGPLPFEVVLEVRGDADIASAQHLRHELGWALSVAGPRLVFDLSGLAFCDLAGLDALVAAERGARAQNRSVRWSGVSRQLTWLRSSFVDGGRDGHGRLVVPSGHAAAMARQLQDER